MSILWIYDKPINPFAGGTERATFSVLSALKSAGHETLGFLVFSQDHPRSIATSNGSRVECLYSFLKGNKVHVVINQIGYSKWLLEEFLARGGRRWVEEGGRIITCLHFDPKMFSETVSSLTRSWSDKSIAQKIRRLGRIALLPLSRHIAKRVRNESYEYLIDKSDYFVILSERHRQPIYKLSRTRHLERVKVIPNPNTYTESFPKDRIIEKQKIALIVSRLDEVQKRISLALLAWSRVMKSSELRDWKLQIVGDGEYKEDYVDLVSKRQIPNVEFVGMAEPEKYYESASIYLHTAKREGWGLTITEAMQKGVVPVVMNSCAVFEEHIEDGKNGRLSKDGNVVDLANDIVELIRDDGKRYALAINAIETASGNDMNNIIREWSEIVS